MAGSLALLGVRTLERSPERRGEGEGGRGWTRALYLVPPAEKAGRVDVGVRLVLIVRHLYVVPHAIVHHLASAAEPAPAPGLTLAAAALETRPAEPRPFRFRPGAHVPRPRMTLYP